jgi:hypothetical protein
MAGVPTRRLARWMALLGGFALLTAVLTAPLAWHGAAGGPVNTGDGQLSIWNVAWVARTLVLDPLHVYDANIFAPHKGTLAYSEANLPAGVLALPAWWLSRNPYLAYNSSVFLSLMLAALATFALVRRLTRDDWPSAIAAAAFAFAPFVVVRYAHIQLLMVAGLPLSLLAMHRFVDRPTFARAAVVSLALAGAGLGCGYYGFFAAIAVGFGFVYYAVRRGTWRQPRHLALCLAAAVGTALVILPFFVPYLGLVRQADPFRTLDDAGQYSADWAGYLTSTTWAHRALLGHVVPFEQARYPERVLFPGVVALILGVTGFVASAFGGRWRAAVGDAMAAGAEDAPSASESSETAWFYAGVAALAAWFSFGPAGGLYSVAYRVVPGWTLLRAPARFGILVGLALAVLAGLGLSWLRHRVRRPAIVLAVAGAVVVLELAAVPWDVRDAVPVPGPYRVLARLPAGTVAEFPFFFRPIDFHRNSLYMLYSTAHWHPLVNGYSDYIPDDFKQVVIPVSSFPAWEALGILQARGTRYVVFHLDLYDSRSREKLLERIERYRDYIRPLSQSGSVMLFEIVKGQD